VISVHGGQGEFGSAQWVSTVRKETASRMQHADAVCSEGTQFHLTIQPGVNPSVNPVWPKSQ
jgi:hypothetical protein